METHKTNFEDFDQKKNATSLLHLDELVTSSLISDTDSIISQDVIEERIWKALKEEKWKVEIMRKQEEKMRDKLQRRDKKIEKLEKKVAGFLKQVWDLEKEL